MKTRGKFITFEGGEGSGKSTQLALLAGWLRDNHGMAVTETREPGGSRAAEAIRSLLVEGATDRWAPVGEVLLHNAARAEHLAQTVVPALERGDWVLCDRYTDSTVVYQGYAQGYDVSEIHAINQIATSGVRPDLTLIMDIPHEAGLERAGARAKGEDRYERMGVGFHQKVREGFLSVARSAPERCAVIDAADTINAIAEHVKVAVSKRFGDEL